MAEFEKLGLTNTALLVIDMQRYFVQQEYPYGRFIKQFAPQGAEAYFDRVEGLVIPNIQRLLRNFRSLEICIVFTEFGSKRNDGSDMPGWARKHNDMGRQTVGNALYPPFDDPSCRIDDSLVPNPGEIVIQKSTSGPVNSTKLDHMLRVIGVDTVIVTGVVTDVCVAQTTREFGDRDFNSIVVEDACASIDETRHKVTLETIGFSFGTVLSTDEVLNYCRSEDLLT